MKRTLVWAALCGVLLACGLDVGPLGTPKLIISPVLDTMFLGDLLIKRQVTFIDAHGTVQDPGVVSWSTHDTSVIRVDPASGKITGHGPGIAVLLADAQSTEGFAVIVVSPLLKVTMLVDTMSLMPGDTLTIPVDVKHEAPGTPTVWFSAAPNGVFGLDTASGLVTANAVGGPIAVDVHAALTPDTVTDGGTIEVVQLSDTTGGSAYYTIFGTAQRARRALVRGSIYPRTGGALTFRLQLKTTQGSSTVEAVDLVLPTPPAAAGVFPIDSISLAEGGPGATVDPFCHPPRSWAQWFTVTSTARLDAVSRSGGSLTISQIVPISHGLAISGHFYVPVQRTDRYDDPSGVLPIRGSFVAPVITDPSPCH
jgi:hypothetical protein